jgi:cullin 3
LFHPSYFLPLLLSLQAFENIVNRHQEGGSKSSSSSHLAPNCIPEYLATYIDEHLKNKFKDAPNEEWIDQRLNECIQLFRFLSAKDVFEEFYKQATAKRLLGGKVASDDLERMMIGKLKAECGANYTNKLEGMFSDLNKSSVFMQAFKKERRDVLLDLSKGCDIDVTVLTAPNWSSAVKPVPNAKLPANIQAAADEFTRYYLAKHNGRKLQWNASKGTAEVKWRVSGGRVYELTVSTYQMIILMAFNGGSEGTSPSGGGADSSSLLPPPPSSISYKDFLANYGIPEDELRRNLLSLCNPKIKILNKQSGKATASAGAGSSTTAAALPPSLASKDIEEDDVFSVNEAFTSKLLRIKVPLISMKSAQAAQQAAAKAKGGAAGGASAGAGGAASTEDAEEVMSNVEEGRKALLESVIVRVMKTRKHMEHNALVAEVIRMVSARFNPDLASIKKRIEHLIDRDYLERSADNHNMYSYLA